VPVFVFVPALALLLPALASNAGRVVGWSSKLPWVWLVQYFLLQSVVLFHVAGAALAPKRQRRKKACVRSLPASWLTNATSTHAFWLATAVAAFKVFRAELKGSLLELVVTPKTQSAREEPQPQKEQQPAAAGGAAAASASAAAAAGARLATATSSASAPTVGPDCRG
jgi:hypothetical protein